MSKNLLTLIISVAVSLLFAVLISQAYPFVLASEEARTSIEVTAEQKEELDGALFASDLIAFGIFGSALCMVIASIRSASVDASARWPISLGVGAIAGGVGGAAMAFIGYTFHDSLISSISDPLVHTFSRLSVMFLPVVIAIAITLASNKWPINLAVNGAVGAALGVFVVAGLYSGIVGIATPLEFIHAIMPGHAVNKYLLFFAAFLIIPFSTLLQLNRGVPGTVAPEVENVSVD